MLGQQRLQERRRKKHGKKREHMKHWEMVCARQGRLQQQKKQSAERTTTYGLELEKETSGDPGGECNDGVQNEWSSLGDGNMVNDRLAETLRRQLITIQVALMSGRARDVVVYKNDFEEAYATLYNAGCLLAGRLYGDVSDDFYLHSKKTTTAELRSYRDKKVQVLSAGFCN